MNDQKSKRGRRVSLASDERKGSDISIHPEDVQQLLHVLGHDLKAPLRGASGIARLLTQAVTGLVSEHSLDPHQVQEVLDFARLIENSTERAHTMVSALVSFLTFDPGSAPVTQIALRPFLEEQAAPLQQRFARSSLQYALQAPEVQSIVPLLRHVVSPLLENAMQFSSETAATILVTSGVDADGWWLKVTDAGCGLPSGQHERAFELFYQAAPDGEGNGIGLAMARRCARQLGATVRLFPEPSGGTSAVIHHPHLAVD